MIREFNQKDMRELLTLTPKEFLQETVPANVLVTLTQPKGKQTFTPSQWVSVVDCLRQALLENKSFYISFSYKQDPKSISCKVERAGGIVTKDNIKFLPRMLVRAWSDITIYDLGEVHGQN